MNWLNASQLPQRDRRVVWVLWVVFGLNAAVALSKLLVGLMTNRLTIIADAFHGFLDASNNIIGVVAIAAAAAPPDKEHPYGHRKFENIAAMIIGGAICLVSWQVVRLTIERLHAVATGVQAPLAHEPVDPFAVGVLIATLVVNIAVAAWEKRQGDVLKSPLLKADAGHTYSDSFVTLLSIASLFLGGLGWWVDPVLAFGVLWFLLRAAWGIISENLPAFTDRARLAPEAVDQVAIGVEGVLATYGIRSHGTENDIHLDLSIVVSRSLTAGEAEDIENEVRDRLQTAFPGLTLVAIHHSSRTPGATDASIPMAGS